MNALNNQGNENYLKKRNNPLENSRAVILHLGYRFVELKSRLKKKVKDSYQSMGASYDYNNIIPSAVEGRRGKKSF